MPFVLANYELRWAVGLALLAVVLTSLPFLIAPAFLEPGLTFSGFLMNPIDGYSYLTKMRQGAEFVFEFQLPYAPEPGDGVLLFAYQMFLGGISNLVGLPHLLTYHAARVFGTVAMFWSCYVFFARAVPTKKAKWGAFLLVLLGSGIGWIALPMELLPIDLWVPEAIPFLSAYANAHFPLSTALLVAGVTLIAYPELLPKARLGSLFIAGLLLAVIQPFTVAAIGAVLIVWLGIEREQLMDRGAGLIAFGLGALPLLVYTLAAIRQHPVLSAWNEQNQTPTPPLIEVLLGYGLVLALAILGFLLGDVRRRPDGRLLITWAILGFLLLYLPIALQRRLALGLFVPLAALAGVGLEAIAPTRRRFALLLIATLLVSVPSHLVVVGSGWVAVQRGEAGVVLPEDDRRLLEWIERNLSEDPLILASAGTGSRLPAFSDARVLYGHPFETPMADAQQDLIEELWNWDDDPLLGVLALRAVGVEFAFYGEEERQLGTPTWLSLAELTHREGGSELYKVPES